jgi:hypothetical protein
MQWWYVKDGKREGPVDEPELKAMAEGGSLGKEDLVWNNTMGQDWKPAGTVEGIFASAPAGGEEGSAPAPEKSVIAPQMASTGAEFNQPIGQGTISVSNPVEAAWTGTKKILFQPFDIGKWFALGFSAWLATLLEGGGSFNFNTGGSGDSSDGMGGFGDLAGKAESAWDEWQGLLVAGIAAIVIIGFLVGIVLMWVRSRGKFMLLDNVVHNRDAVKRPWKEFSQHGNSLFKWTLGYSIVMLLVVLVVAGGGVVGIALPCIRAKAFVSSTIPVIILVSLLWIAVAIVGAYIMRFLEDFIIPIMYKKDMTAMEAWSYFGNIYRANTGRLILYGLFYLALALGAGVVIFLATLLTCCILGCIAAIPYVGAVALLPVPVFFRLYSIHYIAQYGADFDVVTGAECNAIGSE